MRQCDRLEILRAQLQSLINYVRSTPQVTPRWDSEFWAGPFPASVENYDPDTWVLSGCKPLFVSAIEYHRELHRLAQAEPYIKLLVHWWGLTKVFRGCGDLFAASEQAALEDPYWASVLEEIRETDPDLLPSEGRYYTEEGAND